MTELQLLELWGKARLHIVLSQIAPTFLLIVTAIAMGLGLGKADLFVRIAVVLILLASGVLGALVQYAAATQAQAIARDLNDFEDLSATSRQVVSFGAWMHIVRFVTPVIFTAIFILLAASLLATPVYPYDLY
jgi:hypothetical protein